MVFHVPSTADLRTLVDGHSLLLKICFIIVFIVIVLIIIMLCSFYIVLLLCIFNIRLYVSFICKLFKNFSIIMISRRVLW